MIKKNIFIIFFILFNLYFVSFVCGLSITGPILKDTIIFQPGFEKAYRYTINSGKSVSINHSIGAGGDLYQYFSVDKTYIFLNPGESEYFNAFLKLPQQLEAGIYTTYICASEMDTGIENQGVGIYALLSVCSSINVLSLYEEPVADFVEFNAQDITQEEIGTFSLYVRSLSKQDIKIKGTVDIYLKDSNNKIITLYTEEKTLKSGTNEQIKTSLNTSAFNIGEYVANATLYFSDKTVIKEKPFKIGNVRIDVLNLYNSEVDREKINTLNIEIQSKWNSKIEDVYATIEIKDLEGNITDSFNSAPSTVGAWETKNLTAYWDTKVPSGKYNVKIILHYRDRFSEMEDSIEVKPHIELPAILLTTILILILVVLIVILIVTIIHFKKKEKINRNVSKK